MRRRFQRLPVATSLAAASIVLVAALLVWPFCVVTRPPMTDLPMHATAIAALRHAWDPSFHFAEQFELQPFAVPMLVYYAVGAALAVVLPIAWATKVATLAMMALYPIGVAVYAIGLKKSPLVAIVAAGLAFGTVTHWGFVPFVGALGLTFVGLGATLRAIERPIRNRLIALSVVSALVFFTHVSRFPSYVVAVAIVTLVVARSKEERRAVSLALAPSAAIFAAWWLLRPGALSGAFEPGLHFERLAQARDHLFHSFAGDAERALVRWQIVALFSVAAYSIATRVVVEKKTLRSLVPKGHDARRWLAAVAVVVLFLALYVVLPGSIGAWSWVAPREITAAALASLVLVPKLPRSAWLRVPPAIVLFAVFGATSRLVAREYSIWDASTRGFEHVLERVPRAPKLGYIVVDRDLPPNGATTPAIHFPAWTQAERGGWLSFHFAEIGAMPIGYRHDADAVVPPPTPPMFEWFPNAFDVSKRGKWFDWFLVCAKTSPDARFAVDPEIEPVAHDGWWWLYRRRR